MPIYQEYAPFYDGSGQIRFAVLFAQYLADVLVRHPVAGQRALDLACGTGTLALTLAESGYQVIGVDASPMMLAIARERAAHSEMPERLAFEQADLRNLADTQWEATFDLITCTYDSLNYLLTNGELAACFAGVARLLRPGGLFIADMNTRQFLEHGWGNYTVIERRDYVQVSQSQFDPTSGRLTMLLSGFVGDDEHGYRRFDETHVEQAYPPDLVATLFTQAGLQIEAAYECFTFRPADTQAQRVAWVVRRAIL
jgi:ubiquinone/menaquinone biosynthesis C-methylase UbiE